MTNTSQETHNPPANEPSLTVDVPSAARLAGVSPATLWKLIAAGNLPSIRVAKRRLIIRSDLTAWLEGQRTQRAA